MTPIIGFCSGNSAAKNLLAEQIGAEIVRNQYILLTGGRDGRDTPKDHAMTGGKGALAAMSLSTPPLIGVLPSRGAPKLAVEEGQVLLHTGLTSEQRDPIIGVTPDAVIALGGAEGTLAEIAFALSAGVNVVLLNSRKRLNEALNDQETVTKFTKILREARTLYGSIHGSPVDEGTIEKRLRAFLADPPEDAVAGGRDDKQKDAADAVTKAGSLIKKSGLRGRFPGIPPAWTLQQQFNELVQQMRAPGGGGPI